MRSNNAKLNFLGYSIIRFDSKLYLSELFANDTAIILGWIDLHNDALLFSSKEDAASVLNFLSLAMNTKFELRQLFRVASSSSSSKKNQRCSTSLNNRNKLISF